MPTPTQHSRLDRKAALAAVKAFDAFPNLLAECEAEAAARIVADLIKAHFARPVPEHDSEAALIDVINRTLNADDPSPTRNS